MRFIVAAATASEAREWAGRNKVRPCDMLVVLATTQAPGAHLAELADTERVGEMALYGVPVVRLVGWNLRASAQRKLDLERYLANLRPPLVRTV